MLGRRRRRRANIDPTLFQCFMFAGAVERCVTPTYIAYTVKRETAVTAYLKSEQLLLFAFAI